MKRVTVFKAGSRTNGKVIKLPDTLEDLVKIAGEKLGIVGIAVFNHNGGKIDDIDLIRDEDLLFISSEESFLVVEGTSSESDSDCKLNEELTVKSKNSDWVLLNVGGKHFATTRCTLTTKEPNSMLACMMASERSSLLHPSSTDKSGAFLVDRSPVYFEPILNYLRHGQLILDRNINPEGVLEEARFYGLESLVEELEKIVERDAIYSSENAPLTRRDVINVLISTPYSSELRFQGINMAEADLSRLDLRYINFKYANLQKAKLSGANLSYCCLERTDLSYANLKGAVLLGVKMLCANLEGANLRSCNMEDPAGNRANLEEEANLKFLGVRNMILQAWLHVPHLENGVNLKGANLEGSQMAGVNLRVATLKNANLQNCDLRGAVLAGADLENCDLSGSDLHEANLRGANLKDTAFELMLTPLHMAQAIR